MDVSFDPKKRDATLERRRLDFADAADVFEGEIVFEAEDDRRDYVETRIVTGRVSQQPDGRHRLDAARVGASHRQREKGQ